jgi:hypothetical protein
MILLRRKRVEDNFIIEDNLATQLNPIDPVESLTGLTACLEIKMDYRDKVLLDGFPFNKIKREILFFLEHFEKSKLTKMDITIKKENPLGSY